MMSLDGVVADLVAATPVGHSLVLAKDDQGRVAAFHIVRMSEYRLYPTAKRAKTTLERICPLCRLIHAPNQKRCE